MMTVELETLANLVPQTLIVDKWGRDAERQEGGKISGMG